MRRKTHELDVNMEFLFHLRLKAKSAASISLHVLSLDTIPLFSCRWWPAEICNPRLVPSNIQSLRHDIGDFPVFFFGSHDYYWINQGRVFPYVENDKNFVTGQININKTFKKGKLIDHWFWNTLPKKKKKIDHKIGICNVVGVFQLWKKQLGGFRSSRPRGRAGRL